MQRFIWVPGEQEKAKLFEYKDTPMLCQNCLEYEYRAKFCSSEARCRKCHKTSHTAEVCQQERKCFRCQIAHQTGSKVCPEYKYEEESTIQSKERVSKDQARIILNRRNPNYKINLAAAVTPGGGREVTDIVRMDKTIAAEVSRNTKHTKKTKGL